MGTEGSQPKHIVITGCIALLWNAMGAMDWSMTNTRTEEYMAQFTPEQLAYFYGLPVWAYVAWTVAIWCSVIGSACLLKRSQYAEIFYGVSFGAMCLTFFYNYVLTNWSDIAGTAGMAFSFVIFAIGAALWRYSTRMAGQGHLS